MVSVSGVFDVDKMDLIQQDCVPVRLNQGRADADV